MKHAIIFHGTHGSPQGNWFPWLHDELAKHGWKTSIPTLPTPENQSLENWKEALSHQVADFSEAGLFLGHSCGGSFLLRLLESKRIQPKQVIFVGAVTDTLGNQFDELNKSFVDHPFDWLKIKDSCSDVTVFHGDNDPYVSISQAETISENLDAPLHIIKDGGHLNADSGYTQFPELLKHINV